MTEPGYGRLRASNADRERTIDVLKAAFAEGRLDTGEYTDRVGQAHASRTYADLGALVADLPAGPLGTLAPARPGAVLPYPSPVPAPASKPRNTLEIAVLAMVVLIVPAVAILFAVVGGLALLLHG
jgi:hypothetical protein